MKLQFIEVQKFNQWWLRIFLIGLACLPLFGLYQQVYRGIPFGDNPMSNTGLVIFTLFVFGLIALFAKMRLTTEIDEKEIRMRFFPFTKKTVKWEDVKSAEVIKYGFVGGWGIRLWTPYGTVYNTQGKIGLAIELKDGNKFLIGTQKKKELADLIDLKLNAQTTWKTTSSTVANIR